MGRRRDTEQRGRAVGGGWDSPRSPVIIGKGSCTGHSVEPSMFTLSGNYLFKVYLARQTASICVLYSYTPRTYYNPE